VSASRTGHDSRRQCGTFREREALLVNLQTLWIFYRGSTDLLLRKLRRRAVSEVIAQIRDVQRKAAA
jgi:hypothetical protein